MHLLARALTAGHQQEVRFGTVGQPAVGHGVDTFLFGGDPEQLPVFALEVVPAVREQTARERRGLSAGSARHAAPAQAAPAH